MKAGSGSSATVQALYITIPPCSAAPCAETTAKTILSSTYSAGSSYHIKIVAGNGNVAVSLDGTAKLSLSAAYSNCYFKAGDYLQYSSSSSSYLSTVWLTSLSLTP